jgi:hypothetical protein
MTLAMMLAVMMCGCSARGPASSGSYAGLFAPVSMRIHPIFTDVKDWNNDGRPDGIEALLEFEDQFGDPTKAAGTVIFELFTYRAYHADTRGERVVNPWVASVQTVGEQQSRWNRTSRTYSFRLEYPAIRQEQSYVLTATFETGETRFFDRMVLQGHDRPREGATTRPGLVPVRPSSAAPAPAPATTRGATGARDGSARP